MMNHTPSHAFLLALTSLATTVPSSGQSVVQSLPSNTLAVTPITSFGRALVVADVLTGSGTDIVQGAPADASGVGRADVLNGTSFEAGSLVAGASVVGPPLAGCGVLSSGQLGQSVAAGADIDSDGKSEYAVGIPGESRVRIYSGATTTEFPTSAVGITGSCRFGWCVDFAEGSQSGGTDGLPDLLVTTAGFPGQFGTGATFGQFELINSAWLLGAAPGVPRTLSSGQGQYPGDGYGLSCCVLGDLDGDGFDEWAIGAPLGVPAEPGGYVEVINGATGAQIMRSVRSGATFSGYGTALEPMGDLDGDGVPDLAVSEPNWRRPGVKTGTSGRVVIVAGAWILGTAGAQRIIQRYLPVPGSTGDAFGGQMTVTDANGDRIPDVVVTSLENGTTTWAQLYSGRTGMRAWRQKVGGADFSTSSMAAYTSTKSESWVLIGGRTRLLAFRAHDGQTQMFAENSTLCACMNAVPDAGCMSPITMTGGVLAAEQGSASIAAGSLQLLASDLPPSAICVLRIGTPLAPPIALASNGVAGLQPHIFNSIGVAGTAQGTFTADVDLSTLPNVLVGVDIAFQVTYTDMSCATGGPTTTLTNAAVLIPTP